MKSVAMLKVLGFCAVSFLSLSGGAAQAADNCVLSSLSRPAASIDGANETGNCRDANRGNSSSLNQDMVATIAPLVGSMATTGIQTASSVMRALTHEAGRLME